MKDKKQSKQNSTASQSLTSTSKFMSLVLRHQPKLIGLQLDAAGWVSLDELVAKACSAQHHLTVESVNEVVRTSNKQRFAISKDGLRIRANQGHSIDIDLNLSIQTTAQHGSSGR